jgi:hypothetical protein
LKFEISNLQFQIEICVFIDRAARSQSRGPVAQTGGKRSARVKIFLTRMEFDAP